MKITNCERLLHSPRTLLHTVKNNNILFIFFYGRWMLGRAWVALTAHHHKQSLKTSTGCDFIVTQHIFVPEERSQFPT